MTPMTPEQSIAPKCFDVCRSPRSDVLRHIDVYEPWWENGMLFATDGIMAVAAPYPRPEYVGPGCGIHLYNRAIPARRLPELLPLFAAEHLQQRAEPVAIPPKLVPWLKCPCVDEAEEKGFCPDCEGGWLPIMSRIELRPGSAPIGFQSVYLGLLCSWGVDKIHVIPGQRGMTSAAYFRCGTMLGCVQPMAPGEK